MTQRITIAQNKPRKAAIQRAQYSDVNLNNYTAARNKNVKYTGYEDIQKVAANKKTEHLPLSDINLHEC